MIGYILEKRKGSTRSIKHNTKGFSKRKNTLITHGGEKRVTIDHDLIHTSGKKATKQRRRNWWHTERLAC